MEYQNESLWIWGFGGFVKTCIFHVESINSKPTAGVTALFRLQERPAHTYPCHDMVIVVLLLRVLVSDSLESPPFKWQTFDGFLKTVFCSVLERQGRFLSPVQGSFTSPLGTGGGLLEASCSPVFHPSAYHACSSGHAFCSASVQISGNLKPEKPLHHCHNVQGYLKSALSH